MFLLKSIQNHLKRAKTYFLPKMGKKSYFILFCCCSNRPRTIWNAEKTILGETIASIYFSAESGHFILRGVFGPKLLTTLTCIFYDLEIFFQSSGILFSPFYLFPISIETETFLDDQFARFKWFWIDLSKNKQKTIFRRKFSS